MNVYIAQAVYNIMSNRYSRLQSKTSFPAETHIVQGRYCHVNPHSKLDCRNFVPISGRVSAKAKANTSPRVYPTNARLHFTYTSMLSMSLNSVAPTTAVG